MISGKVIKKEIDDKGLIKVTTEFTLPDGSTKTGVLRYNYNNFSKLNVVADIKQSCESIAHRLYIIQQNHAKLSTDIEDAHYDCTLATITVTPPEYDKDGNITKPATTISIPT